MKHIVKIFISLCIYILFIPSSHGLIITHPDNNNIITEANRIFFSGKINKYEKVTINNIPISAEKKGAFSYSVQLYDGENIFNIQTYNIFSKQKNIKYTITKYTPKPQKEHNKFIPKKSEYYTTIKDDVILRKTPIDGGINRLGYLPKETKLYINGKYNEFSRVYLSKDKYGWVMTKDIVKNQTNDTKNSTNFLYKPNKLLSKNVIKTKDTTEYTYTLSNNVPYSTAVKDKKLILNIYNLEDNETYEEEFNMGNFPRYSICEQNGIIYIIFKHNQIETNYTNNKVKIVIDAGHGGNEYGAIGCLGDKEKDINLKIAKQLKKILKANSFDVSSTRECDKYMSLSDRVNYAKNTDACIYISIHHNSVPISSDPNLSTGTTAFYYNPQSEELAQEISNMVSQSLNTKNCGVSQASFAVIRPSEYIGILLEVAYMVNPNDVIIYKSRNFTKKTAKAIYKGLINYINNQL